MTTIVNADDIATARRWAEFYTARGWNVFPSRPDAKRPFVRYAEYWEAPAPSDLFDRFPTSNLQIMTGRHWRLLVIDLDGPEARERFERRAGLPRTWATHSGGGGLHLWFSLNTDYPDELPKAFLWQGEGKHAAIERLCDRSLVMAPPSIHPTTGRRYRFLDRAHSPARLAMPAPCPAWLLRVRPIEAPKPTAPPLAIATPRKVTAQGRYDTAEVLASIPDKIGLAQSWGLRLASRRANGAGWCPCHCIGREDRSPSASISESSGRYWEPGERTIGLFELAVRLGAYLDWRDAVADLGERFGARRLAS